MKKFCLITNVYKDPELKVSGSIREYIAQHGGSSVQLLSRYREDGPDYMPEDIPEDTECILVLGGDGTLIRTATRLVRLSKPLLGINLGTLGYLCEVVESNSFHAVDHLLSDSFLIENRIMLSAHPEGGEEHWHALNDIVIHHGGDIQVLTLNVYINGEFLYTYRADGIIVATPTGSTGYSMSAGGPIMDPTGQEIVLTPNNAHNLSSRSIILRGEDEITIEIAPGSRLQGCAYVSADGDKIMQMKEGDRIIIRRSLHRVRILRLHKTSFLENLRKKMESYR